MHPLDALSSPAVHPEQGRSPGRTRPSWADAFLPVSDGAATGDHRDPRRRVALAVYVAGPVLLLTLGVVLWVTWRPGYWALAAEDHVVEWATFAVYLAAAVAAVLIALQLRRSGATPWAVLFLLLAAGFVLIAGEEISWGQRALDFAGPAALVELNQQGEANVHNLLGRRSLHAVYVLVGLTGAVLARLLAPRLRWTRDHPWLVAPAARLAPWFLAPAVYYVWIDYVDPLTSAVAGDRVRLEQVNRLQEFAELSLSVGFLLFVLAVVRRVRRAVPGELATASRAG